MVHPPGQRCLRGRCLYVVVKLSTYSVAVTASAVFRVHGIGLRVKGRDGLRVCPSDACYGRGSSTIIRRKTILAAGAPKTIHGIFHMLFL